jgi:hypothetical protein
MEKKGWTLGPRQVGAEVLEAREVQRIFQAARAWLAGKDHCRGVGVGTEHGAGLGAAWAGC